MDPDSSGMMTGGEYHKTLTDLPFEVLEDILCCKEISHDDIGRISLVCHKLYDVANSRNLWRRKFRLVWGSLTELYDNHFALWKEEYEQRVKYGKLVQKLITTLCEQNSCSHLLNTTYNKFKELAEEHRFASHFMLDEMDSILHNGEWYLQLTTKFYCSRILHFARQDHLKKVFQDFLAQYENSYAPLDIGATLISQYFQPMERIEYKDISGRLDNIAQLVKETVKQCSPKHPVLFKNIIPTSAVLTESLWPPSDCKIILECLNSTLFRNLKFKCILDDFEMSFDCAAIDKVLKCKMGAAVMIAIIYASVAHRLGVVCDLCGTGATTLKWLQHPELDEGNRYTFIDITVCGKFFQVAEFSDATRKFIYEQTILLARAPAVQVFRHVIATCPSISERGSHYLEQRLEYESNALELDLMLSPNDEKILMLVELYLQMDTRLLEVKDLLQRVTATDGYIGHRVIRLHAELENHMKFLSEGAGNKTPPKKIREECPTVSFAIGMIMKHKKYDYICVIYGWDKICSASDHWIQQMRVYELRDKENQPFYNVLVEDGTQRYAAQENLEICDSPRFIDHPDIGRYFDEFQNTHFVPNKVTSAEYPQDDAARATMLGEFFTSHEAISMDM